MAPQLGKRKRVTREQLEQPSREPTPDSASASESDGEAAEDVQERFRKAFEARFAPLADVAPKKAKTEAAVAEEKEEEQELDEASEWAGISSDEDEEQGNTVEVVEYTSAHQAHEKGSKAAFRAFMSSKPPTTASIGAGTTKKASAKDDANPDESTHLKNDVALQRLLRDSHLLSKAAASAGDQAPTLTAMGAVRHKSTDLQLMALGAKTSIHKQKSMPMSHRKGIVSKAKSREEQRRAEAKEAGIVLEREVRTKKFSGEREKGVGGPSVGKFRGGMLTLTKSDVGDIMGSGGRGGGGSRGGRGGKSKRGKR